MPIEMVEEGESRGLSADRVWQGRRAGQPDTGYWTPHKDKAIAYALYGPRFGYKWGGGVDASKKIPELWSYAPRGREQWPADSEYVNPGDEGLQQAHEARRIAFKRDAVYDPETGKWHQNYSYDEPERMTRMPDADFADIIERIMAREDFQDRLGMAVGSISAKDMKKYPPEIIGADEWGEVFGADIHDEDGLSWDGEELYDLVSGFWDPENVEWDLSTVDYPLAEGTTLQMYVDALRGRNQ